MVKNDDIFIHRNAGNWYPCVQVILHARILLHPSTIKNVFLKFLFYLTTSKMISSFFSVDPHASFLMWGYLKLCQPSRSLKKCLQIKQIMIYDVEPIKRRNKKTTFKKSFVYSMLIVLEDAWKIDLISLVSLGTLHT